MHHISVTQTVLENQVIFKNYKEIWGMLYLLPDILWSDLYVCSANTRFEKLIFFRNDISALSLNNSYKFFLFFSIGYLRETFGKKEKQGSQHMFTEYYKKKTNTCNPSLSACVLMGNTFGGISCRPKSTNGPDKFKISNNSSAF